MKNPLQTMTRKNPASASVVDGKLILSFPHALSPVVWQMELGEAKASALEVLENKEEGSFSLALKTPRGENVSIAAFQKRADAVSGLMAASRALESGHGKIHPGAKSESRSNSPGAAKSTEQKAGRKWPGVVLGIAFVVVLLAVWGSLAPRPPSSMGGVSQMAASGDPNAAGVPVSADAFLRGR